MSDTPPVHWADTVAQELLPLRAQHLISTGITPSGDYHVGHLREVLTAEGVYRALRDHGADCRLSYVADTMDPLRRVYAFLDPAVYQEHVGKPLCDVPCPCGAHASYAEHFLAPFLEAMQTLGVQLEVLLAHETYRSGKLDTQIIQALEHTETIKRILHDETGKQERDDWSPYNALCAACGRLAHTKVTGFDAAAKTVSYTCTCGHSATAPVSQGGKLTWRVDWPARWQALGVTVEPFGKDHASRGGSYDTGKRIVREVFGGEPPYPVPYEWIALKGQGDMSSSKGNLVSIFNLAQTIPPEVVRYMIFRVKPMRSISFDPACRCSTWWTSTTTSQPAPATNAPRTWRGWKACHRSGCRSSIWSTWCKLLRGTAPDSAPSCSATICPCRRQRCCVAVWPTPPTGWSISARRRSGCVCRRPSRPRWRN